MRKLLSSIACGVLALSFVGGARIALAEPSQAVAQVAPDKVYIVGGIADEAKVRATMESLESSGLSGAFLVPLEEVKQYINTVRLLQARGHVVVVMLGGSTQQPRAKIPPARSKVSVQEKISIPAQAKLDKKTTTIPAQAKYDEKTNTIPVQAKLDEKTNTIPVQAKLDEQKPTFVPDESTKREFAGVDKDGASISAKKPLQQKDNEDVPEWSIASMVKLADYGLLMPEDIYYAQSVPTREFMAKLIVRAYRNLEGEEASYVNDANQELQRLMTEYDTEVRNLGYGAGFYAASAKLQMKKNLKIGGEVRYNYRHDSGDDPYNDHDARLRTRINLEKPFTDKWSAHAMVESEKSWFKDRYDGKPALERLYLQGEHKDVGITAGRYGREYADGTIYDGRVDGVGLTKKFGEVETRVETGRLRDRRKMIAMEGKYSKPEQDVSAGVYHTKDKTIATTATTYYLGNWGLGARLLYAKKVGVDGKHTGYVMTARYGRNKTWVPGSYEFYANYYYQPSGTYIAHTMVGLADSMNGFKGYGLGFNYTIMQNLVYDIEFYDLKDLHSSARGRTLWNHLSYYF